MDQRKKLVFKVRKNHMVFLNPETQDPISWRTNQKHFTGQRIHEKAKGKQFHPMRNNNCR